MYEILEHTADAKFRAEGETLEDALREVVEAFAEVVGAHEINPEDEAQNRITVNSENLEALVFDFLDRLIYTQDVEGVAVLTAETVTVEETETGYSLTAVVETVPLSTTSGLTDIKAPTYNDMRVEETDSGWLIQAVLDI
ncbi:MAG: archease [Halobacteria archaeon]|nr:archease [Halobacteria archaeon]